VEPYLQRSPYTDIRSRFLSRLTYPTIFPRLYTFILIFLEAVEPNLQRHPYTNIRFEFPSSHNLRYDLYPPLYLHFNFFLKRRSLTSNVTPTQT